MMSIKMTTALTFIAATAAVMSLGAHRTHAMDEPFGFSFVTPALAQDGSFPLWQGATAQNADADPAAATPQAPADVIQGETRVAPQPTTGPAAASEPVATDSLPMFDTLVSDAPQTPQPETQIEVLPSRQEQLDGDWKLFSEGRRGELRGALVDRQINDPGWPVPEDLMAELDRADVKTRINNAVAAGQYRLANKMLAMRDDLLSCDDIWFGWSMVEATVLMEQEQRGIALARRLNTECDIADADLRDGLLRLADRIPPETMSRIITEIDAEIDPALADDLARVVARQQIYNWITLQDAEYERRKKEAGREHVGEDNIQNLVQRRFPEVDVTPDVRQAVSRLEERTGWSDARDRAVLGWFYYHSGDFEEATEIFSQHVDGFDENLRLDFGIAETWSRLQQNNFLEAERVLPELGLPEAESFLWSNPYLMVVRALVNHVHRPDEDKDFAGIWEMPTEVKERVYRTAKKRRDATLTQQIGWLEQRSCRCSEAIRWFRLSLEEDDSQEDAAWGLAICLNHENRVEELEALRLEWSDTSPRIAGLISAAGGRLLTVPRLRPSNLGNADYRPPLTGAALSDIIVGSMQLQKEEVPGCWPSDSPPVTHWDTTDNPEDRASSNAGLPSSIVPTGGETGAP